MFPAPTAFLLAGIFFTVLTAYLFCSVRLPTPLLLFTLLEDKQQLPLLVNDQLETSHVNPNVSRRIVAVGDLHGDFPNALTVLRMTGVVDGNGDWTGNVDYLVQTGDIIDR